MRYIVILILLGITTYAQENLESCGFKKAIEILDTSDLQTFNKLDEYVNGKRIVLISEESHTDGTSYWLQSKMVRYLHAKHNFDLFLDEMCFFANRVGFDSLVKTGHALETYCYSNATDSYMYKLSGYENWKYAEEQLKAKDTLVMGAIDFGFSTPYTFFCLKWPLTDVFKTYSPAFLETREWDCFQRSINQIGPNKDTIHTAPNRVDTNCVRAVINQMVSLPEFPEKSFWAQVLRNYLTEQKTRSVWSSMPRQKGKKMSGLISLDQKTHEKWNLSLFQTRDIQMFQNLQWYLEKYPDKKVIVRVSSAHSMRNSYAHLWSTSPEVAGKPVTLGDYIFKSYPEQTYSVAFVSHHGLTGYRDMFNILQQELPKRRSSSMEGMLHDAGMKTCFVDLKKMEGRCPSTLGEGYYMTPTSYCETKRKWSEHYNSIFFIDRMDINWRVMHPGLFDLFFNAKWTD